MPEPFNTDPDDDTGSDAQQSKPQQGGFHQSGRHEAAPHRNGLKPEFQQPELQHLESQQPESPSSDPQQDDHSPHAAEAWTLINQLLDDVISDDGIRRLEALAVEDPAIARMYVRVMHLWSQLPLHVGKKHSIPTAWRAEATSELLGETMILDALRLDPAADAGTRNDSEDDIFQPAASSPMAPERPSVWQRVNEFKKWIGIAAVVILCLGVTWLLWPATPPAVVVATAGLDATAGTPLQPGNALSPDQPISLSRGAVEIRFRSGATVTIAGPAQFSLSQKNAMSLRSGVLAAHVPHDAVGFAVDSPGLRIVDLGTSFGIRTIDGDQGSEAAVFEGNVTASATDPQGQGLSDPLPMSANMAATHTINGGLKPLPTAFAPEQYPRDISKIRLPLRLFDTGAEVSSDGGDAHWNVEQVSMHPAWTEAPAEVFHPGAAQLGAALSGSGVPNLSAGGCIGPRGIAHPPSAGEYVFRTTVDLSGFEPNSAVVVAHVFATEAIVDIRVNGIQAVGASLLDASNGDKPQAHTLQIPAQYLKPGTNTLDFVVNYLPDDMPSYTFAGLSVVWDASASLVVKR